MLYKYLLHLAKYSNYSTQFNHNTKEIPATGLNNTHTVTMLGLQSLGKKMRVEAARAH